MTQTDVDIKSQNAALYARQILPISVIMVSYMTGPALIEAIEGVLSDDDIAEFILVDNGNTEMLKEKYGQLINGDKRVSVLEGHGNIGFARGCNYGAQNASGDYLLFLNPDAVIQQGAARALAKCGAGLNRPWITGGLLNDVNGHEQRGARRGALTPASAFMSFTGLNKVFKRQSIHQEGQVLPSQAVPMQTISGAFLMIDRDSFDLISGFDEAYFLHVEDIDICRRVYLAGGIVYFVPDAVAMHYGSTSNVRRMKVEFEKLKGFLRYFWNYNTGVSSKFLTVLAAPFISAAILGRAVLNIIRQALRRQ